MNLQNTVLGLSVFQIDLTVLLFRYVSHNADIHVNLRVKVQKFTKGNFNNSYTKSMYFNYEAKTMKCKYVKNDQKIPFPGLTHTYT